MKIDRSLTGTDFNSGCGKADSIGATETDSISSNATPIRTAGSDIAMIIVTMEITGTGSAMDSSPGIEMVSEVSADLIAATTIATIAMTMTGGEGVGATRFA